MSAEEDVRLRSSAQRALLTLADDPEGWDVAEEFVACPAPAPMEHRRLLVYHRCEDSWVTAADPSAAAGRGFVGGTDP